ncbi:xylulose kinase [candidate division KSB3 bacterium]|uniref:Xylulose kinase n=1 Tax=candidate division KSB3 bacterium TaxID=2044937 RepID=A0A2G6E2X4_9BACT|nr:MAG: xylulose kinase [candidate division KSB3 bacterium]PIE28902.1 MAG: xylulose kinase [candidate division KSB3 bacterium]
MSSRYVLGIDAGTESIRVVVFDEQGVCMGVGSSPNRNIHTHPGWAEQSIRQWEYALVDAMNNAIAASGVHPESIEGIGLDGTSCTVVFLDRDGVPLRDAIIWMDVRAHKEAEEIAATNDPALKYVGYGNVSAEWFPCKVLWVKRHEPEIYERAHTIFEHSDWLLYTLTGEITANINTTSIRWFYDSREGFPRKLYETIGLGDIFTKLPSKIVRLGEAAGGLCREIADRTGLKAGIPVAGGGADAYVGVIGVNALTPGTLTLITGSSHLHIGLVDKEFHASGIFGTFPDAVLPGYHVVEAGQISTGSVLKWFKDNFVNTAIQQDAERRSMDVYDVLCEAAQAVPPGAEGLVVLEHWQGNRTPWVDPTSRGVIRGLTLRHSPAHLFRAIMEAVAYGTEIILKRMEAHGVSIDELVACGGATQSNVWMQIHADVTGKRITIPTEQQAVSLGAAVLATVGAGFYPSIPAAAAQMVRVDSVVEPDMRRHEEYKFYVDQYVATYEQLKDESKKTVQYLEES